MTRRAIGLAFSADESSTPGPGVPAGRRYGVEARTPAMTLRGWWRLKIACREGRFAQLEVAAVDSGGRALGAFHMPEATARFRCYVYLGAAVRTLRVRLCLDGGREEAVAAELRPISLAECLWRAVRSGAPRRLRPRLGYFLDPEEPFVITGEFPQPAGLRSDNAPYRRWIAQREPALLRATVAELKVTRPEPADIAILLTVCDPPPVFLRRAIDSVRRQSGGNWQLCIADDASSNPEIRAVLAQAARADNVRIVWRAQRGGISAATNSAFALASAPLVACLDHDDMLAPHAIEVCGRSLADGRGAMLYSDEDKIDRFDQRFSPFFKPGYSPDLLRSYNYFNHLTVHRADTIRRIGGWRSEFDGAQDYDLVLRATEVLDPGTIRHVPQVLYHWRTIAGSTAMAMASKHYATEAGRLALEEHCARRGVRARAVAIPNVGYRMIHALPEPPPKVSIVVPVGERADPLLRCVSSILTTAYPDFELLLVDTGCGEPGIRELLDAYRRRGVRVEAVPGPCGRSALNNRAAATADGELLCFLAGDLEVVTPDWLGDMVGYAIQEGVGCVGAKIYAGGAVDHAGLVLGVGGTVGRAFAGERATAEGYFRRLLVASNYSAVSGACLLLRRAVFAEVGGFDAVHFPHAHGDVDLCLRVARKGYRNVFTPFAELCRLPRGAELRPASERAVSDERAAAILQERHGALIADDPCYSPHLSRASTDFAIAADL